MENNPNFYGVFSSDTLLNVDIIKYPASLIVNTDESNKAGEHWVAFHFPSKLAYAEYFDSYGLLPLKISFYKFLPAKFKYSTHMIQNLFSKTCGEHCIYFLNKRSTGMSMQHIISTYTTDTLDNDNKVKNYISKIISNHCIDIQAYNIKDQKCLSMKKYLLCKKLI